CALHAVPTRCLLHSVPSAASPPRCPESARCSPVPVLPTVSPWQRASPRWHGGDGGGGGGGTRDAGLSHVVSLQSFQGSHGRAYLFNSVVNVGCGPAEQRLLLTGLHSVADIFCESCKTTLGWKYAAVPTGAGIREQPEVQGGEVYHRDVTHGEGERLGLSSMAGTPQRHLPWQAPGTGLLTWALPTLLFSGGTPCQPVPPDGVGARGPSPAHRGCGQLF
uniref:Yippee like 4 n=1 Tax=Gallus gallus TaxID=9031 RepID=A0A8V1AAS7_CHICK